MKTNNTFEIYRPNEFHCLVIHGDKNNKLVKELKRAYQPRWKRWWRMTRDHLDVIADIRDNYGRQSVGEGHYVKDETPVSVIYVNVTGDPSLNRFHQHFSLSSVRYDDVDRYYYQHPITQVNICCITGTVPSPVMNEIIGIYEKNKLHLSSGIYEVFGRFYAVKTIYPDVYEVSPTTIDVNHRSPIGLTKDDKIILDTLPLTKLNLTNMLGFCEKGDTIHFWNYETTSHRRIKSAIEIVISKKSLSSKDTMSLSLRRHGKLTTFDIIFKKGVPRVEAIKDIITNLSHLDVLREKGVKVDLMVSNATCDEYLLIFGEEYALCIT